MSLVATRTTNRIKKLLDNIVNLDKNVINKCPNKNCEGCVKELQSLSREAEAIRKLL